jgi:two-component system sensor histidine kinase QseC
VKSIRTRLLVMLLGATLALWLVAVALSYRDARAELGELFDAQLAESAKVILAQASHDARELRDADEARERFAHTLEHPYEQQLHFRIRDRRGRTLYESSEEALPESIGITRDGFADLTLHGERWRVLLLTDREAGLQIEMCQRSDVRSRLATAVARNMLLPIVVSLPLLAVLVWVATTRGIAPLEKMADGFLRRSPDDLRAIRADRLPSELVPLIAAINGLFDRLSERFEVERRFTADAAHELRTPLAAIRTQVQVAKAARDDAERDHALAQAVRAIDRTSHLTQQLLTLARVDRDSALAVQPVELGHVVRSVAAELAPYAIEKGITLEVAAGAEVFVPGNATLLATLSRNLLENAIRYCARGDEVGVAVDRGGVLRVVDTGPGIPPADRERVFDRFHRVVGSGESGSGLGLSIVRRIAELHGATVTLTEGEGGRGIRVEVRFPESAGSIPSPS